MLEWVLEAAAAAGVEQAALNAYHLKEAVTRWVSEYRGPLRPLISKEEALLGTGGGLKRAARLLEDRLPILVHNADVFTEFPLSRLLEAHRRRGGLATLLAVRGRGERRLLVREGRLEALVPHAEEALTYTGIGVYGPGFLEYLPDGPSSLTEGIEAALRDRAEIFVLEAEPRGCLWEDMGTPQGYLRLNEALLASQGLDRLVHPTAAVSPHVRIEGWFVAGRGTRIGPGAVLGRTVVWPEARVPEGLDARGLIVTPWGVLKDRHGPYSPSLR